MRLGNLLGLWSEVVVAGHLFCQCIVKYKKQSRTFLAANARCTWQAMENRNFRKAVQALASDSLASASASNDVLAEILSNSL